VVGFALGADAMMGGKIFAGVEEACGESERCLQCDLEICLVQEKRAAEAGG